MSRTSSKLSGLGLEEVNIHDKRWISIKKSLTPTRSERIAEGLDFLSGNAHKSLRMEHNRLRRRRRSSSRPQPSLPAIYALADDRPARVT